MSTLISSSLVQGNILYSGFKNRLLGINRAESKTNCAVTSFRFADKDRDQQELYIQPEKKRDDEGSQQLMTLKQPFAMGKHEVIFEKYNVFAGATRRRIGPKLYRFILCPARLRLQARHRAVPVIDLSREPLFPLTIALP